MVLDSADVAVVAMPVDPDRLLPAVGRERKNTVPDAESYGTMLAIFVSRWWHGLWEEAIRSVAGALSAKVATIPAVSVAAAAEDRDSSASH